MSIEIITKVRRCPGYKHTKPGGTPPCGYTWDPSPPPHGEGTLCPKCWHKPNRVQKRIVIPGGQDRLVPEDAIPLHEEKNKVIVEDQHPVTGTGQDYDEANWDAQMNKKKKEKPTWSRCGKK